MSHELIERAMRDLRRRECLLAAVILRDEPERLAGRSIGDFLEEIHYVRRDTLYGWLQRAAINPWRPGEELKSWERQTLSDALVAFARQGELVAVAA